MAVSLDLGDPVLTIVNALNNNFSEDPVTVLTGYTRGGYKPKPPILPIEGAAGKPTKGRIDVKSITQKAIVQAYEVSDTEIETDAQELFADVSIRVSIDIRHGETKARLVELYNEIRRILMKVKHDPGGNYTYVKRLGKTDLTNKTIQLFRYVVDVELVKISEYIGHV